jgi:adenine-specific DNA-methyltransferase
MPTLDWIGKKAVLNHHNEVPYRLLRCNKELSVGDPGSGNLLVQGDNLEALKALLPYYAGKCIYIDPPYNTGNENWVYNDAVNSPEMRAWLGKVVGSESDDLSRHDKWLCMMYPRLSLLRPFLRQDGVILVSIDDSELHHLRCLVDDVFGPRNWLATMVWQKGKKGDAKYFSNVHEYIAVIARSKAFLDQKGIVWRKKKDGVDAVLDHYASLRQKHGSDHTRIRAEMQKWYRGLPVGSPAKAHKHYNWSDDRGLYFADNFHGPDDGRLSRPRYDIIHPSTGKSCKKPSTGWRWEEPRTRLALADNPPRIHFGPDETTIPCRKTYLFEVSSEPQTTVFYKDGRGATVELEQILGPGAFSFPKDSDVLADLLSMLTDPGDLVLDSFAGTGTTGHAVLKLNRREAGNGRQFILVEMDTAVCAPVAAERLKRAVSGYTSARQGSEGTRVEGLGGGFRFCELGPTLFDADGRIRSEVSFRELAQHMYFAETGEPLPATKNGKTPLLGVHGDSAVYLLFNGVLKDKAPDGGNVLTRKVLDGLPPHEGPKVVYGTACRVSTRVLKTKQVTFRQIPYEVRTR